MRAIAIVALLLALSLAAPVLGDINPVLSYQGSLKDSSGAIYPDGSYSFTFSLYTDSVGGLGLWTEVQTLPIKNGLLHAYLGSVTAFDPAIFSNSPIWLGIRLGVQPEFRPRHAIGSAVYSFISANAMLLQGLAPSHFVDSAVMQSAIAAHESDPSSHRPLSLDASEITSGTISEDRLPIIMVDSATISDLGITETDLADASVSAIKLKNNSVNSDKVEDGSLSGQDLQDSTVSGKQIAPGAIRVEHLSISAFDGSNIIDGGLTGVDFADSSISGQQISQGSIDASHLSFSAFGGTNIIDGSLTGADIADSTIHGNHIAPASITSTHLSSVAITGAQIVDNSVTGSDITNGTIGFNDIGPLQIGGTHMLDGTITSSKLATGSVSSTHIIDESINGADIASNAIVSRHILTNAIASDKIADEPGIDNAVGGTLSSVSTTVVNWMSLTVDAPAQGVIIVFMNGIASLQNNEIAQMAISTTSSGFTEYGEAKIATPNAGTGCNMTISISKVIPVAAAGPVAIYGNVRSIPLSAGPVDFLQGQLQAIYIRSGY